MKNILKIFAVVVILTALSIPSVQAGNDERRGTAGASELLLKDTGRERSENEGRAIILFNSSSSAAVDKDFLSTIAHENDFFPSPALFVYTLPNMVTGEIAIRNECHAETSFYICRTRDDDQIWNILRMAFSDTTTESILGGWIDYYNDSHFEADIFLVEKTFT